MTILQAIKDRQLFRPFFGEDLKSWAAWGTVLRAIFGIPLKDEGQRNLIKTLTGRDAATLPENGFDEAILITGRRSGKSRISAAIAGYISLFTDAPSKLAPGEIGVVACIAPSKEQASIVWKALQSLLSAPLLEREVVQVKEVEKQILLRNGLQIRVFQNDWRITRGFTLVAVIVDEAAFLSVAEDMKIRNDQELFRSLRPALSTVQGKLIAITSPYAKKGHVYKMFLKQHGENRGVSPAFVERWTVLVIKAPSRVMNPTLDPKIVEAAMLEDKAAAMSEYGGEFRDDISNYIDRSLVESLVIKGRRELLPHPGTSYFAFVDVSGGRQDDSALAIAHKEGRRIILDLVRAWHPPFSPQAVVAQQADLLKRYGLHRVTGDNYSGEFVAQSFRDNGIAYTVSPVPKSGLYLEFLPRLCSNECELLDNELLIDQISGLERRTRAGGQDVVDHPPGSHDDLANVAAGVCSTASKAVRRIGVLFKRGEGPNENLVLTGQGRSSW